MNISQKQQKRELESHEARKENNQFHLKMNDKKIKIKFHIKVLKKKKKGIRQHKIPTVKAGQRNMFTQLKGTYS